MTESITKLQRWLDLIAFLVGRKYPVSVDDVMEAVPEYGRSLEEGKDAQTVRRMFERDKDELRALGIPIETVDPRFERTEAGYRLTSRDFYLPYLRILGEAAPEGPAVRSVDVVELAAEDAATAREALGLVADMPSFPLRSPVEGVLRKLSFDLGRLEAGRRTTLVVERPDAETTRDRLQTLNDAIRRRKRVAFGYRGIYRGERTERDVEPYALLFTKGNWYLIGHDRDRDARRIFRIDRMEEPEVNRKAAKSADFEVASDFDLAEHQDREAWELDGDEVAELEARVLFRFPRSLWAARNGYGELEEERGDGSAVRRFDVHQVDPFLRWVLSLAGEARILAPPELVQAFGEVVGELRARYARGSS